MSAASDEILREFSKRQMAGLINDDGPNNIAMLVNDFHEAMTINGLPKSDTLTLKSSPRIIDALKDETKILVDGWKYPNHEGIRASIHAVVDLWLDALVAHG